MAWYENPRWRERLAIEQKVMRSRFPQLVLRRSRRGNLYWDGIVLPVPSYSFRIRVSYPPKYPYDEPRVFVVDPELRDNAPHVYPEGHICVHPQWDPHRGLAASSVALAAGWLLLYVHWLKTGERF